MSKKRRVLSVGFVVLMLVAVLGVGITQKRGSADEKEFTMEVISERDQFYHETEEISNCEFLGQWMRETDLWQYTDSDYGIYVQGYQGYMENLDEQYWWCLSVNGEVSSYGADEVPIEDGAKYTWELKQGW